MEYLIQVHGAAAASAQVGGLSKEFQGLAASQEKAGAAGVTAGGKMGRLGSVGALAGKGLVGLAAAAAAVGFESVKMANTFNTEMLKIRTEGGASSKEFNHMKSALLDMASNGTSMGQGPEALAKGLYHVESMGMRGRRALLALKLASQEAAISGADLEQTTTSLGGAVFIAAKGTGTLTQTMGALNAIAGAGNMRFQDLNEALGTGLLGAAKIAGISLQETGAALAVLTDSGYKAASAGAQLATSLHFLYHPTKTAETALSTIGLSGKKLAADLHKPQGLLAAMKDLKTHMHGLSQLKQANVLGSILPGGRGRVLANLYLLLDRLGPKFRQIMHTSDQFNTHVMEQGKNQATRLAQAHARLQAGMVRLGTTLSRSLTPALISLQNAGSKVLAWTNQAIPVMAKLAGEGFARLGYVVRSATTDLVGLYRGIKSVIDLLPSLQLPSLPGGGAQISGSGTPAQRNTFNRALNSVGIPSSHAPRTTRTPLTGTGLPPIVTTHAAVGGGVVIHQHTGDFVVHVAGKEWARITRREMQKAMMAGG